jgi:hypothetical protein
VVTAASRSALIDWSEDGHVENHQPEQPALGRVPGQLRCVPATLEPLLDVYKGPSQGIQPLHIPQRALLWRVLRRYHPGQRDPLQPGVRWGEIVEVAQLNRVDMDDLHI